MGQQQLLLIVLGVIIVGIAVVVGINVFTSSAVSSNKDSVSSDLMNLGSMAQQHYRKPASMGGGGNTFNGSGTPAGVAWDIPSGLATTGNGTYSISAITSASITILGTGNEKGANGSPITITATVTPTNITTSVTNP